MLEFEITNEPEFKLTVYDEETIKKHDLVGEAVFFLQGVTRGEIKQKAIEILFKGKMAGTVYVDFDFKGRMGKKLGNAFMAKLASSGINTE